MTSCRQSGHAPAEPVLTDDAPGCFVRAVVNCRRCGSYVTSFEGALSAVRRAAASSMHGLRFVPV